MTAEGQPSSSRQTTGGRQLSSRPLSASFLGEGLALHHGIRRDFSLKASASLRTVVFHPHSQGSVLQHDSGYWVCARADVREEHAALAMRCGCSRVERLLFAEDLGLYVAVCSQHLKVNSGEVCVCGGEMKFVRA